MILLETINRNLQNVTLLKWLNKTDIADMSCF